MRRFVSIWLPTWPTDRWRRRNRETRPGPLVLAERGTGGLRLAAVDEAAAAEGLTSGMSLADARALVPRLAVAEADPAADAQALGLLADWCQRYTPVTMTDGPDGLLLDITGCAHLFGSEGKLLTDLSARLGRAGVAARAAAADAPAAAWAWARFRPARTSPILAAEGARASLIALPITALRLPDGLAADLARVGLRRIGDLLALPRAPLARRYGKDLLDRLDRMFGRAGDPLTPRRPPAEWRSRLALAEPVSRREDFETAATRLLEDLCRRLGAGERGARRLALTLFRVDTTTQRLIVGTSRPSRDPKHLLRLFRERFERIDPGFGVEAMLLEVLAAERLAARQVGLTDEDPGNLTRLIDRLHARTGERALIQPAPRDTHLPERATVLRLVDPDACDGAWPGGAPRPVLLLPRPERITVDALLPGGPPIAFRWRGRHYTVGRLEGPERIAPEWWREPDGVTTRDYYRVEELEGRRFWLFCTVDAADWYLHGLFA